MSSACSHYRTPIYGAPDSRCTFTYSQSRNSHKMPEECFYRVGDLSAGKARSESKELNRCCGNRYQWWHVDFWPTNGTCMDVRTQSPGVCICMHTHMHGTHTLHLWAVVIDGSLGDQADASGSVPLTLHTHNFK